MKPLVLSIGYGRSLFDANNEERVRLAACAEEVDAVHHIVFTRTHDRFLQERVSPHFSLYPTGSFSRVMSLFDAFRIGYRLMRTAKNTNEWVITAQDPLASGLVAYALHLATGRPLVLQEHGDIFSGYWKRESLAHRLWHPLAVFLVRRATRVRAVSQRVRGHLMRLGVSSERIVVLPVYTDATRFAYEPFSGPAIGTIVSILTVARFVPQKNLKLLIEAFARVYAANPNTHLTLVGAGPLESVLRRQASALKVAEAVTWVSWSKDVPIRMKNAHIYALSSNYEGWGRVLIEAMTSGLPIVTTDVGCVSEICKGGEHALVVPIGDTHAFSVALRSLVESSEKRRLLGERGRAAGLALREPISAYAKRWAEVLAM